MDIWKYPFGRNIHFDYPKISISIIQLISGSATESLPGPAPKVIILDQNGSIFGHFWVTCLHPAPVHTCTQYLYPAPVPSTSQYLYPVPAARRRGKFWVYRARRRRKFWTYIARRRRKVWAYIQRAQGGPLRMHLKCGYTPKLTAISGEFGVCEFRTVIW